MKKIKRIWILNHYAITPNLPGGTRHFDIGRELTKKGKNIVIFASNYQHNLRKYIKTKRTNLFKREYFEGIEFLWVRTFPYFKNNWRRVVNMLDYFFKVIFIGIIRNEKPDVIVGSSVHIMAVLAAYILAKIKKAKFIFEVRDLWPQTLVELGNCKRNNLFAVFLRLLEKFLYLRAEKIINLLPRASDYNNELGIPKEKVVWIPNGVDLKKFKKGFEPVATDNRFIIMYIGAHGRANVLDVILDAARIIQDKEISGIKIVLIGDGPEKETLINKAYEMNLVIVKFKKPVPKENVPKILLKADGFIICLEDSQLYKYGISLNKMYDYLASGKPVIFSGNSINNPVEKSKSGLIVPPKNPRALANAIIKLYNTPVEEREEMGKRARKYVEKYHNIEKLANKFLKAIS